MAVPIGHFSVGVLPGLAVWVACLVKAGSQPVRRWVLYVPIAMVICGLWSMVPDFPKALGGVGVMDEGLALKLEWAQDSAWDLCFFHYSLDRMAGAPEGSFRRWVWRTSRYWGLAIFIVSFGAVVTGYLLELAKRGALPRVSGRARTAEG